MNRRQMTWVAGSGAMLGLLAGLVSSPGLDLSGTEPLAGDWQLPVANQLLRHDSTSLEPVSAFPWKGKSNVAAAGTAEPESVMWQLRGIVNDPEPTVLVDDGQGKILRFRTGAVLPNGATLVGIAANRIQIETDGCLTSLALHRDALPDTVQQDACATNDENPSIPGSLP